MAAPSARRGIRRLPPACRLGEDPQQAKVQARLAAAARPMTFADLVEAYVARRASKRQRPKTLRETERHLRVHLRPLPTKPAAGIILADIAGRLQELVEASGPIAASGCRSALHALFVWAMRSGLLEANPLMNTDRPGEERTRDRVVSDDELCQVWAATEGPGDYNAIVRLLILTGQRREEVGGMRRDEIDLAPGFVVAAG